MTDPTPVPDLRAAIEALADEWEQDYPSPAASCSREADEWWRELRAVLAAHTPPTEPATECRCQIVGWTRDPYEPHIPAQPEWEQADDCPAHPLPAPAPVARDAATLTEEDLRTLLNAEYGDEEWGELGSLRRIVKALNALLAARQPVAAETEGEQA